MNGSQLVTAPQLSGLHAGHWPLCHVCWLLGNEMVPLSSSFHSPEEGRAGQEETPGEVSV